jgi:hypothetical protein
MGLQESVTFFFLRFEVLKPVVLMKLTFSDMALCSLVDIYQRFGGISCLHLQGRKSGKQVNIHRKMVTKVIKQ